jgi:hypothetical protein
MSFIQVVYREVRKVMIGRQAEALEGGRSNCILIVVTEKRFRIRNITSSPE